MSRPFLVGDRVKAFGCEGVIVESINNSSLMTMQVCADFEGQRLWFCGEGKFFDWNKEPSLVHLDPPAKKMVKKKMWTVCFEDRPSTEYWDKTKMKYAQIEVEVED